MEKVASVCNCERGLDGSTSCVGCESVANRRCFGDLYFTEIMLVVPVELSQARAESWWKLRVKLKRSVEKLNLLNQHGHDQ